MQQSKNDVQGSVPPQNTIELKTPDEIDKLRTAGRMAAEVLRVVTGSIRAGVTTKYIDELVFREIGSLGAKPAFLGYRGYPAATCISLNNELVHGVPRADKIINDGDIVSVDLGLIYQGFYGDTAATIGVGAISAKARKLIEVTREALARAIGAIRAGSRMGDLAWAIQDCAQSAGFSVVRDYVGHGIGRRLHEDPPVPNFGKPGTGVRLNPGMVIAIEPMLNEGNFAVKTLEDGWTVVTADGKLCAHFEHMVAVTEDGCEILTK